MLVLIDLQNDYFHSQGKFYFPGAAELVAALQDRIRQALTTGEPIIYTLNLYTAKDGRSRGERDWAACLFEPFRELLRDQAPVLKYYYGISPLEGKRVMEDLVDDPPAVIQLAGVETHLCLLANAVIFQNMFPEAGLLIDPFLVASSDPAQAGHALQVMLGMNLTIPGFIEE